MSPPSEPMTFDELSELYRVEMKSSSITQARPDLFRAMADLESRLRNEFDKQMSIDPESVMCEGANQHRKKAELLVKNILHIRTQKICQMAIRGAMGADNDLAVLTKEEREYYEEVLRLSRSHLLEVDRLRGRKTAIMTHIDEPPVHAEVHREPEDAAPAPKPVTEEVPLSEEPFDDFPEESFDDFPDEPPMEDIPPEAVPAPEPVKAAHTEPVHAEPEPAVAKEKEPEIPETVPDTPIDTFEEPDDDDLTMVVLRILEDLPPFVGPDRDYNLLKEDIVTMPKVMAEALVNVEKAVVVRPSL